MKTLVTHTILLLIALTGCKRQAQNTTEVIPEKKELLIHCGVTMAYPIQEIAAIIEKKENCKITITKGGSGNLYKSIVNNKIGDLYLPGSKKYIDVATKENIVTDKVFVGHNKAVILVKKGNPKHIEPNCKTALLNQNYRIVMANPLSGSIGKEAKRILNKMEIYDMVESRVAYMTIDSRDIITALKNNEADIGINWYATSTWEENKESVDVLVDFESEMPTTKDLYIGLLVFSQYPTIAKKFMAYASSEEGIKIFKKYGLYFEEK